mgnify:CR=1 FL=1
MLGWATVALCALPQAASDNYLVPNLFKPRFLWGLRKCRNQNDLKVFENKNEDQYFESVVRKAEENFDRDKEFL